MFEFKVQQKTFEIAGVKIGGSPGLHPTVLIGTIFYQGHRIVKDVAEGLFDRKAAEDLLNLQSEFSDRSGIPCMLDVVGSTSKSINIFTDFVAGKTDGPILLDGVTGGVRMEALRFIRETGLNNRIIYNSLTPDSKPEEFEAIREAKLSSAILLAYSPQDFTSQGRIQSLIHLLPRAKEVGIEKPLLDTYVLDLPSLGQACLAIYRAKDSLGYPAGCGAHNALSTLKGLRGKERLKTACLTSVITAPVALGADFLLYGPIEDSNVVFPAVAMVNAAQSQIWIERGIKPSAPHPRYAVGKLIQSIQ